MGIYNLNKSLNPFEITAENIHNLLEYATQVKDNNKANMDLLVREIRS